MADKRGARKKKQPNAIQRYFRETLAELRKVSWPTRKEATNLTRIVIIVMVLSGLILGALDILFSRVFALLLS